MTVIKWLHIFQNWHLAVISMAFYFSVSILSYLKYKQKIGNEINEIMRTQHAKANVKIISTVKHSD